MGRRLFHTSVRLGLIAGAVGAAVVIGKKLMGGLGPTPGSDLAPKEWPSLVAEPSPVDAMATSPNGSNGSNGAVNADAGAATDK